MNFSLRNEYPSVTRGIGRTYGGSQMLAEDSVTKKVGCGVVAAADLLICLSRAASNLHCRPLDSILHGRAPIPLDSYNAFLAELRRQYFPLIPGHGINGLLLSLGINRFFEKNKLPYHAFWGVPYTVLWQKTGEMLEADIPVILSIGPNFPLVWRKQELKMYCQAGDGQFQPGPSTHAHYVVVTAMDDTWLQISSWGRKLFINKNEYLSYVMCHSSKLVSNILYVRKKP